MVDFGEAQFIFAEASCPIRCIGAKTADFLDFAFSLNAHQPGLFSHGHRLRVDTLAGFNPELETEIVVPAHQRCFFAQVKRSLIEDCLEAIGRPELGDRKFLERNYVHLPETLPPLKGYVNELLTVIHEQPGFLQHPQFKQLVLEDFIPLLLNAIPSEKEPELGISAMGRAQLVKEAEDFMMAHLDHPLTLKSLCNAINSSERPLFYGFQEIFGLSPMGFLKVQRLYGIRRALQIANPCHITVQQTAQRFGFWNMGHFSKDYKLMFGECPSDTLTRPVRQFSSSV
jgi:AraC family ethanolamine operon transcriptional activator